MLHVGHCARDAVVSSVDLLLTLPAGGAQDYSAAPAQRTGSEPSRDAERVLGRGVDREGSLKSQRVR